ncbi:MAG: hypothetical protein J6H31_05570 [Butyrivibrio sp.]|nr:hypothetical protein [Butyrivibrio sp.]
MGKILIIANKRNYTAELFAYKTINVEFSYRNLSYIGKVIKRLWYIFKLPYFNYWYDFSLKKIPNYDLIILFECTYPIKIINDILTRKKDSTRIIYWLWNSVDRQRRTLTYNGGKDIKKMLKTKRDNVEIWTFDKGDCEKYGINYNNQVLRRYEMKNIEIKNEVFFCGQNKNRYPIIKRIANELKKYNVSYNFIVIDKFLKNASNGIRIRLKELAYEDMLLEECACKCILDIVQEGQKGLTWRPLEAMFYKKKLITNFNEIKQYDFYNPNNVFIIDEDRWEDIKEFITSPYVDLDDKIIDQYTVEGWLNNFFCKSGDI